MNRSGLMLCVVLVMLFAVAGWALEVGDAAPDFAAAATGGKEVALAALKGKWVVLYFYPKADTPGCTKESCSLRDGHRQIKARNAVVLGVSLDQVAAQEAFKKKYELPFRLISDADKKVATAYGVLAPLGAFAKRKTFVIDPQGKIAHVFDKVNVAEHQKEVLEVLARLQGEAQPES